MLDGECVHQWQLGRSGVAEQHVDPFLLEKLEQRTFS